MELDDLDVWLSIRKLAVNAAPNWRSEAERCISCEHCERRSIALTNETENGHRAYEAALFCDFGHDDASQGDVFLTRQLCLDYAVLRDS